MSDFHKVIITAWRGKSDKLPPGIRKYGDYKNLESKIFNNNFQASLKNFDMNNSSFIDLKQIYRIFIEFIVNCSKFMSKELSKAIS